MPFLRDVPQRKSGRAKAYAPAFLNNWVAMGSPAECIEKIRAFADASATTITLRLTG
jgi:alkanesulfonate monooxygenase SsuD/methylene tetrahydromethanopterin reductase-like flavin-dependent oxidoreductase (luciferase family)